jgi:hypothetical protein
MSNNNPCLKKVDPKHAYEVWQSPTGEVTYYVLKKYKSPQEEEKDPFAAWYVWALSPAPSELGEYSDMYHIRVKEQMVKVDNSLCDYLCVTPADEQTLLLLGIPQHQMACLETYDPALHAYYRIAVPKTRRNHFMRKLKEFEVRIVCMNVPDYVVLCKRDVLSS